MCVAGLLSLGACTTNERVAKDMVAEHLRPSGDVAFRKLSVHASATSPDETFVCGQVDAKTEMGFDQGYVRFVVSTAHGLLALEPVDSPNAGDLSQAKVGCDTEGVLPNYGDAFRCADYQTLVQRHAQAVRLEAVWRQHCSGRRLSLPADLMTSPTMRRLSQDL